MIARRSNWSAIFFLPSPADHLTEKRKKLIAKQHQKMLALSDAMRYNWFTS